MLSEPKQILMYKLLNSWMARMDLALVCIYLALFSVLLVSGCAHELVAHEAVNNSLKIVQKREGDSTRFYVHNLEQTEVTVTFEMELVNLKTSVPLPYTATFPANSTTEAFLVSPLPPVGAMEFQLYEPLYHRQHPGKA